MDYSNITELHLSNKGLTQLPDLSIYTNLKVLNCSRNQITSLDNLPHTITKLHCSYNQITRLDNLPTILTVLDCAGNLIATLDNLPQTITELFCSGNPLQYDFEPTLENIRKHTTTQDNIIKN